MKEFDNKKEDLELINKAKLGDEKAFEKIVNKYKKSLEFTILNIVRDENVVEDIVLDTFLRVFKNLDIYNENYSFSTWVFTIATNLAIDYTRKKKHIRFKTQDDDESQVGIIFDSIENKSVVSPEASLINENSKKVLRLLVEKLRPDYRIIIELRYFEEMSYKEIADKLDIKVSMVKTKLHRAKKKLKEILKNYNGTL